MRLSNDIKKLIVTEKSTSLKDRNIYVFKVDESLSKFGIAENIAKLFNVEVVDVRTVIMPSKRKVIYSKSTRKQTKIRTGRFKKAYVQIKEGQVIDLNKENK
jgi:large subunit ribosomal protein L23